jgi:transcriptional regulator with XRE-family HTH domain
MSDDVRRLVGRNVKRLRLAAGISQAKLAERLGIDRAYVSGLELGQRNPTVVTLWHVSQALGVMLRSFFEEGKKRRSRYSADGDKARNGWLTLAIR